MVLVREGGKETGGDGERERGRERNIISHLLSPP